MASWLASKVAWLAVTLSSLDWLARIDSWLATIAAWLPSILLSLDWLSRMDFWLARISRWLRRTSSCGIEKLLYNGRGKGRAPNGERPHGAATCGAENGHSDAMRGVRLRPIRGIRTGGERVARGLGCVGSTSVGMDAWDQRGGRSRGAGEKKGVRSGSPAGKAAPAAHDGARDDGSHADSWPCEDGGGAGGGAGSAGTL